MYQELERKPGNLFSKFIEEIKDGKGGKLITDDLYGWDACQRRRQYILSDIFCSPVSDCWLHQLHLIMSTFTSLFLDKPRAIRCWDWVKCAILD